LSLAPGDRAAGPPTPWRPAATARWWMSSRCTVSPARAW